MFCVCLLACLLLFLFTPSDHRVASSEADVLGKRLGLREKTRPSCEGRAGPYAAPTPDREHQAGSWFRGNRESVMSTKPGGQAASRREE